MQSREFPINLESLLDLSAKLNEKHDENFIMNSALLSLMGKFTITRAAIFIPDNDKKTYKVVLTRGKKTISEAKFFGINEITRVKDLGNNQEFLNSGYKYFIPVLYQQNILALITLGEALDGLPLSTTELHYANLVATITANALQNTRSHNSLINSKNRIEQRNQLLGTLFEMSKEFSTILSKSQILKILSYRLMGQLMVSRFSVYLFNDEDNGEPIINRFESTLAPSVVKKLSKYVKSIAICDEERTDKNFEPLCSLGVKVLSPMTVQGIVKGILLIGRKMSGEEFSEENIQFIEALANTAISALENERLFEEELEKKKLENELELALEIQKNLLPKILPTITGYDISGISIPSRHVGGDYYDYISMPDGRLLVAIADVSGKGMPASLIMANLQAALRVLVSLNISLTELIIKLNEVVYQNTSSDRFVTFFCGILNPDDNTFSYINAGHNPPFHIKSDKRITQLTEGGLILGFTDELFQYYQGSVRLEKGDIIFMFTDGITEAKNRDNDEYSELRLVDTLTCNIDLSADLILNAIIDDTKDFIGDAQQYDDMTLSVIKMT